MGDDFGISYGNYNYNGWGQNGYTANPGDFAGGGMGNGLNPSGNGSTGGNSFANMGKSFGMNGGFGDLLAGLMMGNQNYPNAANSGMPYLNQIPGAISPYFNPYIQAGQSTIPQLQSQYSQLTGTLPSLQSQLARMTSNPGGVVNQIGQGFQQSPGYQFQTNQALGAANRAAAAGGMLGSPQEQQNIAGTVNGLANQDYYNYLNHGMSMYDQGLQGQMGLYGMGLNGLQQMNQIGYGASSEYGNDLMSQLMSQANLAYAGQANQNQFNQQQQGAEAGLFGGALNAGMAAAMG